MVLVAGCVCFGCTSAETRGDGPAAVTPCKDADAYESYRLAAARFLAAGSERQADWSLMKSSASGAGAFGELGEGLRPSDDFPIWLECVDWAMVGDRLAIQVVNFGASCGVQWEASTSTTPNGAVEIVLENPACEAADCICPYDVRGRTTFAPDESNAELRLVQVDCEDGSERAVVWSVPLGEEPDGTRCRSASDSVAEVAAGSGDLFENCAPGALDFSSAGDGVCADDLTCVEERCVPACEKAADCPLGSAFTCDDGYCRLVETVVVRR